MDPIAGIGITQAFGVDIPSWSPQTTLAAMDRLGIQTAVVSVSAPGFYFGNATFTRDLVRQCNEDSAALVAEFPTRFGVFAGLPLPDVESTLREIEHALDTLNLDGICHYSPASLTFGNRNRIGGKQRAYDDRSAHGEVCHESHSLGASAACSPVGDYLDDTGCTASQYHPHCIGRCWLQ